MKAKSWKFRDEFFIETTQGSSWESNEDRQISSERSRKMHVTEAFEDRG
jgi:hypothetical protein